MVIKDEAANNISVGTNKLTFESRMASNYKTGNNINGNVTFTVSIIIFVYTRRYQDFALYSTDFDNFLGGIRNSNLGYHCLCLRSSFTGTSNGTRFENHQNIISLTQSFLHFFATFTFIVNLSSLK